MRRTVLGCLVAAVVLTGCDRDATMTSGPAGTTTAVATVAEPAVLADGTYAVTAVTGHPVIPGWPIELRVGEGQLPGA